MTVLTFVSVHCSYMRVNQLVVSPYSRDSCCFKTDNANSSSSCARRLVYIRAWSTDA